jgi:hypothetical protein
MIFAMIVTVKPGSVAADQAPKNNYPRRARALPREPATPGNRLTAGRSGSMQGSDRRGKMFFACAAD